MSTRPRGREDEINFGGGMSTMDVYDEATHRNYFFHEFEAEINKSLSVIKRTKQYPPISK